MQLLLRNFNQVERVFSTEPKQRDHSITTEFISVDGSVHSEGVPIFKEIVSVSVLNSHDFPIDPPLKVRGQLSITARMSFTGWPLWPSPEMGSMQIFSCCCSSLHRTKTGGLLIIRNTEGTRICFFIKNMHLLYKTYVAILSRKSGWEIWTSFVGCG